MTIAEALELTHRAKTKIARARRVGNVHEDIEIMDGLVSLVETYQEALRNSATAFPAGQSSVAVREAIAKAAGQGGAPTENGA